MFVGHFAASLLAKRVEPASLSAVGFVNLFLFSFVVAWAYWIDRPHGHSK